MLKLLGQLPKGEVSVALSGGVDSVVAAYFLSKTRKVTCYHFNHGTPSASLFENFVVEFCAEHKLDLCLGKISQTEKPAELSWEEFWRNERYAFLEKSPHPVVTGHNLDDQIETWIWSSAHGTPKLIPYKRGAIIRPFLLCSKEELKKFAKNKGLNWVEDPSNTDCSYMRNYIRINVVPHFKKINPGIEKVLIKKITEIQLQKG